MMSTVADAGTIAIVAKNISVESCRLILRIRSIKSVVLNPTIPSAQPTRRTVGPAAVLVLRDHLSEAPVGLPLLVAAVPVLAFAGSPMMAVVGVLLWGAAGGVLDSTVKALVADLVPASRRATAYGVFAAVQGAAAIAGGVMAGALYERALPILIAAVAASQLVALVLLIATLHRRQRTAHSQSSA